MARWQLDTAPGTLNDGTEAPRLQVTLSTAIEHLIKNDTSGQSEPVVVQRTVIIRGFKPLGGPDWWPGIGIQMTPLFGGKCAPANGSILTPSDNPKILKDDLKSLRSFINKPTEVNAEASSDASSIKEFLDLYCED